VLVPGLLLVLLLVLVLVLVPSTAQGRPGA
jgi:hypothetical protein